MSLITRAQLTRLQTLYSQWERNSLDCPGPGREQRVGWARAQVRRPIASFGDLTLDEGKRLIDLLQNAVGRKHPAKPRRRGPTTRESRKQGTEGRRDQAHAETTLAGDAEVELLRRDLALLGWDQARLQAYLDSSRSPLKGRSVIRTLGDANKLHWALKRIHEKSKRKAEATT